MHAATISHQPIGTCHQWQFFLHQTVTDVPSISINQPQGHLHKGSHHACACTARRAGRTTTERMAPLARRDQLLCDRPLQAVKELSAAAAEKVGSSWGGDAAGHAFQHRSIKGGPRGVRVLRRLLGSYVRMSVNLRDLQRNLWQGVSDRSHRVRYRFLCEFLVYKSCATACIRHAAPGIKESSAAPASAAHSTFSVTACSQGRQHLPKHLQGSQIQQLFWSAPGAKPRYVWCAVVYCMRAPVATLNYRQASHETPLASIVSRSFAGTVPVIGTFVGVRENRNADSVLHNRGGG